MRRIQLGFLISLCLSTAAGAQSVTYSESYDTTVVGEPVASVEVFYDQLSPYGIWLEDPSLGRVFVSEDASYVPYTTGYWQYTNVGFVWVSSEPFAWATAHYGRWAYSPRFGRWVWRPDTTWGPSWVEWRQQGDYFGWAPMAPEVVGYAPPVESWHYCNASYVLDVNVSRHYEPRTRVVEIHRAARPIINYTQVNNTRIVVGPSRVILREHNVRAVPQKIDARVAGRFTATEKAAQVKRAEQRRAVNIENNRKRLDAHVALRAKQAEVKPSAVKAPEPKRPEIRQERPAQPKVQPKPEPRRDVKPEPKRVEPKSEQRKAEPKRVEPKPEQRRPEPKRVEPKPEQRKPEPRREVQPEPKRVEPKPEQRKPEPRREVQPEPKRDRPEPKRAEPKAKPEQRRPEPKPENKPKRPTDARKHD